MSENHKGHEILAQVIREHYALGTVGLPQPVEQVHQRRHRKLYVKTSLGPFLVKTYRRDPVILDALRFQHRLSDHLDAHGVPVARIQRAADGRRVIEVDNWALELQEFVEGVPLTRVSKDSIAVSAEALGRFHEVCRDLPRPERDTRMWRFSEVPRATFAEMFESAKGEGDEKAMIDYCNTIALFLRDAGTALDWEARNKFETGLIHGDWHGGNLIFQGDRLAAVVDLEFAGDGCYLEDLAYAISNLCIRTTMRTGRLDKRTDVLLDHYQKYRTLSITEEFALYYAVGIKHVATVSYQIRQQDRMLAGYPASSWMERLATQCDWLSERAKKARWRLP